MPELDRPPYTLRDPLDPLYLTRVGFDLVDRDRGPLALGEDHELQADRLVASEWPGEFVIEQQLVGRIFDVSLAPGTACRFPIGQMKCVIGFDHQVHAAHQVRHAGDQLSAQRFLDPDDDPFGPRQRI